MNLTKEKITGLTGSFVFCMLILLILFFTMLRTVIANEEEGVLVNFGNVESSTGMFEPAGTNINNSEPISAPPPASTERQRPSESSPMTQDVEESVAIADAKKKDEKKKQEEQRLAQEEQRRIADAEQKKRQEDQRRQQSINNQVSGAFGIGNSASSSQGSGTSGTGNEGSPGGNSDHGANTGIGGYGEFSLSGRSVGSGGLPRPVYTVQEEGRIVIDITVDTKGRVIVATIGKGTNIDNASMRKSALDAAKKATFNVISGSSNQSGTITYKYFLK